MCDPVSIRSFKRENRLFKKPINFVTCSQTTVTLCTSGKSLRGQRLGAPWEFSTNVALHKESQLCRTAGITGMLEQDPLIITRTSRLDTSMTKLPTDSMGSRYHTQLQKASMTALQHASQWKLHGSAYACKTSIFSTLPQRPSTMAGAELTQSEPCLPA